jgi:hypothetical protein
MTVWYAGWNSTLHTRQSSIRSDKYQVTHRYTYFSWWWAHSRPKHVQKGNKHSKKNCAPSWLYLQGKVVSLYALKAYSSSSTMSLDRGELWATRSGCFTLRTEPLTEATWAPQLVCTFCSREEISCPCLVSNPGSSRPHVSHYTDWAIPTPQNISVS